MLGRSQRRDGVYLIQDVRVWDFTFQLPGNTNVGLGGIKAGARGPHNFNTQCLQNIDLWEGKEEMQHNRSPAGVVTRTCGLRAAPDARAALHAGDIYHLEIQCPILGCAISDMLLAPQGLLPEAGTWIQAWPLALSYLEGRLGTGRREVTLCCSLVPGEKGTEGTGQGTVSPACWDLSPSVQRGDQKAGFARSPFSSLTKHREGANQP